MTAGTQVSDFWEWFSSIAQTLASRPEDPDLLDALDRRILSLGDFSWEMGPGVAKPYSLVISGVGHEKLEARADHIINAAPQCADWEFYSSKPPKLWDLQFEIEDENGRTVHVDARSWRYVLLKLPDGVFDLMIEAPNLKTTAESSHEHAAEIAVEGELGQKTARTLIGRIEVLTQFPPDLAAKATAFKLLAAHIAKLGRAH